MRRVRRSTTPPIFFPGKENGRCDRPKERRLHCKRAARRAATLADATSCARRCRVSTARRFASAPTTRCCAAVGGSAALRMRHTPCGCRSAHLAGVRSNLRLPRHYSMRRAQQCRYFASSLPPGKRHSRLTTVRRGCCQVATRRDSWRSHVHRTHTAQRVQPFKLQTRNGGVKGQSPLRSLGGPRGPFSHVREWPPFPYPPRVWGKCSTTYKWSISAHSTVYISSRCRRGRDRCGRSSGPCGAAFSPCRRRRWRRRCRRPRARA